ncbi:hypothetical protein SAMD00019534_083240 [Acytostelium subglobosum LB1]|uniref:hypothetical protein n=1 Tax=Acytostelium subglobosum LB1 TaxID=1410327 RepID=UPI0006451420|nr:hypothetical protein SAMD00019534_083240 [Acytostelium subglobosum LB1]GAM25149.1 hypothetical protein SAMD00019534_083240 [Acytostelium subglobosum LB1]|eukprot:XP_012751669.1 hypothetical protein SAMD00019534_083240 [Acytostelium subglobosum LB1]
MAEHLHIEQPIFDYTYRDLITLVIVIALILYNYSKRERKIIQFANTFKEILKLTPTITIIEICYDSRRRIVKTSNPINTWQDRNVFASCSNQQHDDSSTTLAAYKYSIERFCKHLCINPDTLEQSIKSSDSSRDIIIKGCSDKIYKFSGHFDAVTMSFRGAVVDISKERLEMKRLKYKITHDHLTGLQNRYQLNHRIKKFCSASTSGLCAIYFLDINRFKLINDTHGHENGDKVLKHMSNILQNTQGPDSLPIRLSGDEFLIVKRNVQSMENARAFIGESLAVVSSSPVELSNGKKISVTISYGGVVFKSHHSNSVMPEEIIKLADEYMYHMKKHGLPLVKFHTRPNVLSASV